MAPRFFFKVIRPNRLVIDSTLYPTLEQALHRAEFWLTRKCKVEFYRESFTLFSRDSPDPVQVDPAAPIISKTGAVWCVFLPASGLRKRFLSKEEVNAYLGVGPQKAAA